MIPIYVPDFKKKLDLLIERSGFKNLAEIADEMGVKEPTLRSWTKNRGTITEGMVSKHGREPVIKLFCAHLNHLSEKAVIGLLEGPYDDMAVAFLLFHRMSLSDLISRETSFEGGKVVLEKGRSIFAARIRRVFRKKEKPDFSYEDRLDGPAPIVIVEEAPKFDPQSVVPIGREFRLEFPLAHRVKYFLGLQQTSQSWAAIAAGKLKGGDIAYMPKPLENGDPAIMCEYHDHGPSRFTLIQSMRPFPDFIYSSLSNGVPLARTELDALSWYLLDLPKADRSLHSVDIAFI